MHRLGTQDRYAIILLVALSSILFCASGYVNQVPLHDDKAYLNNALIHSGRLTKNDALGPYADERPPLFWWMLTTIFLLDTPIWSAKLLSPLFGVILVLATYCFAKKIFNSIRQGFYAALFLTSGAFMMSTTGALLSDVPGTALATLFMFCLYFGTTEKRNLYLLATGPLLAFSLIVRDQNLILFPILLFYLATRLRLTSFRKAAIAFVSSLILGVPVLIFGLTNLLTVLSNLLTPLVTGQAHEIPFTSIGFTPTLLLSLIIVYSIAAIRILDKKLGERMTFPLALLLFFITMYPYLWDNYLLGARYEIAGRGVLSRLISHQIMSETIGVGVELTATSRAMWWLSRFPLLVSLPMFLFATVGFLQLTRKRLYPELAILFPWLAFTSGFTVFFNYLEARFLIPSLPVLAIIASKGIVDAMDWIGHKIDASNSLSFQSAQKLRRLVEASVASLSILLTNIIWVDTDLLSNAGSLAAVDLLSKVISPVEGWYSSYSAYLQGKLRFPSLNLDPVYVVESVICLFLVIRLSYEQLHVKLGTRPPRVFPIVSVFRLAVVLGACVWVAANYGNVAPPLRPWLLIGLAVVTSAIFFIPLRKESVRVILSVYCMFLVTLAYISYLTREVVIASLVITSFVTVFMYLRVARELMRRKRA